MEANNMKAMREALRQISRVAVEMTRGTITGDAPSRKEVDRWAMQICVIIDSALSALCRESATTEKSSAVGNSAAMREALVAIRKALLLDSGMGPCTEFHAEVDRLTATALDSPPRNCDVGTAKEQEERFRKYCWNHSSKDKNMECQCPIDEDKKGGGCKLTWAQMPYEEGGEK